MPRVVIGLYFDPKIRIIHRPVRKKLESIIKPKPVEQSEPKAGLIEGMDFHKGNQEMNRTRRNIVLNCTKCGRKGAFNGYAERTLKDDSDEVEARQMATDKALRQGWKINPSLCLHCVKEPEFPALLPETDVILKKTKMNGGGMILLDVQGAFEEVSWIDVRPDDIVYYQTRKDPNAHGPFTVVDPEIGRLRNAQDVELNLPQMQLLKLVEIR